MTMAGTVAQSRLFAIHRFGADSVPSRVVIGVVNKTQLAIDAGEPIRSRPFSPWPRFLPDDLAAVTAVLQSGKVNYWTGDQGMRFEAEFGAYCGAKYGLAVANGTAALEMALLALDIGPGAEVITPCRSFVATASCIAMRGATPVFSDIDRDSQVVTAETVRPLITSRTRAILAVHLAGWPCDMDSIRGLAADRGLQVIEDCSQAHGAAYKGRPVGCMGDLATFSFCQDKIMTTGGEGGMLLTNDESLWRRAWSYRDHGKSYEAVHQEQHPPGYRWVYESIGTNWRLTEMQAALGRLALRRLDAEVDRRRDHARRLNDALRSVPALRITEPPEDIRHSYYKYYVFVRPERLRPDWSRDRIMEAIGAEGVPCYAGGCSEIYLEKAFEGIRPRNRLPVARELGESSLMFLVHPMLSDADITDTIAAIRKVMDYASS